jgi:uncharacterized membrane protein YqaE (UPF0057 family)
MLTIQQMVIAIVIGFFLPFVTTFLTGATWPNWLRFICVIVAAGVVGAVEAWAAGSITHLGLKDVWAILGAIYIPSATVFWGLIKTTGLAEWLASHGVGAKAFKAKTASEKKLLLAK